MLLILQVVIPAWHALGEAVAATIRAANGL